MADTFDDWIRAHRKPDLGRPDERILTDPAGPDPEATAEAAPAKPANLMQGNRGAAHIPKPEPTGDDWLRGVMAARRDYQRGHIEHEMNRRFEQGQEINR